jgi:molybdopterin-guanine dinucleotide biosynthesis protein A
MGGCVKGLLSAPDGTGSVAERTVRVAREALPLWELVLVGGADHYACLCLPALSDAAGVRGPLSGLLGLLKYANDLGATYAIALPIDMPMITPALVRRLATEAPCAGALAPRLEYWEPLFCRYRIPDALPAAQRAIQSGKTALRAVLESLGASTLQLCLTDEEALQLQDWDTPADVSATQSSQVRDSQT